MKTGCGGWDPNSRAATASMMQHRLDAYEIISINPPLRYGLTLIISPAKP